MEILGHIEVSRSLTSHLQPFEQQTKKADNRTVAWEGSYSPHQFWEILNILKAVTLTSCAAACHNSGKPFWNNWLCSNNSDLQNAPFLLHPVAVDFVQRHYVGKLWWHLKTRKFWPEWLASSAHQDIMWSRNNCRINRFQNNDALVDGLHVLEED